MDLAFYDLVCRAAPHGWQSARCSSIASGFLAAPTTEGFGREPAGTIFETSRARRRRAAAVACAWALNAGEHCSIASVAAVLVAAVRGNNWQLAEVHKALAGRPSRAAKRS